MVSKPQKKRKAALYVGVGLLVFLLTLRGIAPYAIEFYVDHLLDTSTDVGGDVEDIDLSLFRGGASVQGFKVWSTSAALPFESVNVRNIDISVQWKALLRGRLVTEFYVVHPFVKITMNAAQKASKTDKETKVDIADKLMALIPFSMNRFELQDGVLLFEDSSIQPKVKFDAQKINAVVENLQNVWTNEAQQFTNFSAQATLLGHASLSTEGNVNPFAKKPTFTVASRLLKLKVKELAPFTEHYARFDFESGELSVVTELKSENAKFDGYVKAIVKDAKLVDGEFENLGKELWEGLLTVGAELLDNDKKDQLAVRLKLDGNLEDPRPNIWHAIYSVLYNAYIQAIIPRFDNFDGVKMETSASPQ